MTIFSIMTVAVPVCAMIISKIIIYTMRPFKANFLIMMMMGYNSMSQ